MRRVIYNIWKFRASIEKVSCPKSGFCSEDLLGGESGSVGHPEGGPEDGVELLRLVGSVEPEGVALLEVVLTGRVSGHEAKQAAGWVTGRVRDPLQRVAHHDLGVCEGGDRHSLERYRHQHILAVVISRLQRNLYHKLNCLSFSTQVFVKRNIDS